MKVECELEEGLIEHDGRSINGVTLTCGDCEHCVSRPGYDTDEARRDLLDRLRTTCPERSGNHYVILD